MGGTPGVTWRDPDSSQPCIICQPFQVDKNLWSWVKQHRSHSSIARLRLHHGNHISMLVTDCALYFMFYRFRQIICKVISFKNLKYLIIIYLFLGICKLYYFGHFNEILEQCSTWGTHICIHTVNTRVGDNSGRVFFEVPRCMLLARY